MVKSIQKAIQILYYLSNSPEKSVPLKTISQDMDMNKTTCARILETLHDSQMVEHISSRDGYRLGPGAFMLSRYGNYQESLISIASPIIKWINRQLECTALLAVSTNGAQYIITHEGQTSSKLTCAERIIRGSFETSATGKLILAFMDNESANKMLIRANSGKPLEPEEIAALDSLKRELIRIRKQGYAHVSVSEEYYQSYAFPIHDGKRTVAALGIMCPDEAYNAKMRERIIRKGKIAGEEISRRLVFRDTSDPGEGEEACEYA